MNLQDMLNEYGETKVNELFMQYYTMLLAKAMKYDELVNALDENGCNMAKICKILRGDIID